MSEGKEKTQRRVYVLPTELVDRILAYQQQTGLASEVEAARRLLDDALKQRDTFLTITNKFIEKRKETKSLRDAARDTLADHPLVMGIQFADDEHIASLARPVVVRPSGPPQSASARRPAASKRRGPRLQRPCPGQLL